MSTSNIIHMPRNVTGKRGERCARCNSNLHGHITQMQRDGTLWCVVCVGERAVKPKDGQP
jgi:formamidopyrimidine-DNA glycosylase